MSDRHPGRCRYVVPGSGGGDRCRRAAGHVGSDRQYARFHFPDCGSAVDAMADEWITSARWIEMFEDIQASGERTYPR